MGKIKATAKWVMERVVNGYMHTSSHFTEPPEDVEFDTIFDGEVCYLHIKGSAFEKPRWFKVAVMEQLD